MRILTHQFLRRVDMEEKSLNEFFSPCGDVVNIRIIRDSRTGVGKGFGYVLFKVLLASAFNLVVTQQHFLLKEEYVWKTY